MEICNENEIEDASLWVSDHTHICTRVCVCVLYANVSETESGPDVIAIFSYCVYAALNKTNFDATTT